MQIEDFKNLLVNIKNSDSEYMYVCYELVNEQLYLKDANNNYLELHNFNQDFFNKEISSLFDNQLTRFILEKYYYFRNKKEELSTLFISDKSSTTLVPILWKYHIRHENNIVYCIGKQHSFNNSQPISTFSNLYNFHYFNFFFITVSKIKCSYYIKTDDPLLLDYYQKSTLIGENLGTIDLFNYYENVVNILDECIQAKKIIEYVDSSNTAERIFFYKVRLIPSKNVSNELQLIYTIIPEAEYENEQYKKYSVLTFLPHGALHGIVTILWDNATNHYSLDCINEYAHYLIEELNIDLKVIISAKEYQLTQEYNIFTQNTYLFRNKQGLSIPLTVNFLPLNTVSQLSKILVVATKPEQYIINRQVDKLLTHRELEVATLIAQNKTNKYIAYTLKITEGTVKRINYNIYQKLGISSRVELTKILYHCAEDPA